MTFNTKRILSLIILRADDHFSHYHPSSQAICYSIALVFAFLCLIFFFFFLFSFQERALAVTELGSALKFETDEPHFVSLGGGRLSIGVTLCPIKRGKMR